MRTDSNRASSLIAPVGIIFQLSDGTVQSCNADAAMILGYTAEQVMATNYLELPWQTIHRDGSPFPLDTHPAIASIKTGQPYSEVEMGFYRPDGSLVWLWLSSQPIFETNSSQPYGVVTTIQKIADEQRDSTQLETYTWQPGRDFIALANAIPGVMYLFDAIAKKNIYVNSQTYELLGYTREQVLAMGEDFISQVMHPEDLALFPAHLARLENLKPKEVSKFEYRMRHQNGEWRWFGSQERVYSRNAQGDTEQILGIAKDISDRKQTEAELAKRNSILQSIVSETADFIFIKDLEGRYVIANQATADFFDLTIEEILGKDDTALFEPDVARVIREMDRRVMTSGETIAFEEKIAGRRMIPRSLLTSKCPWRDDTGKIIGVIAISRDITELKQSQQQLQENEELLRLALANAKAGSWSWDILQNEVIWSPENYDLYGIDPQIKPLQYQDWENLINPEDLERTNREVAKVLSGESAEFRTEFRIIHPQKGVRWLLGIGDVTCNENGEALRLSGLNLDISDRQQAEVALRQSRQQLRILVDSLPIFAGFLSTDGIVIEINQTALDSITLQPEDILDKPFAEVYWWSYSPEIQARIDDAIKRAAARETVRFDIIAKVSEEKFIVTDFGIVPKFNAQGQVEYLVPFGMDVTDREASKTALKQREYELELITEVIPQHIWTATIFGKIDYINRRCQQYTGVSLEQIQQYGWASVVHPDDLYNLKGQWIEAIRLGQKCDLEVRLRKADGSYCWFLSRARPLRNEEGTIIKWYGTNTSIVRIKELEEELRQQTEDLIRANQLKDEFLAIVSHELRTPLNPILGWSQLLASGRLNAEKTAVGIETIERNAKLQSQLIEDLLDVSRILRGKLNLKKTPLNLEAVIRSALQTIQLTAEAKSIQVETVFEPNIGLVLGDVSRLQQIIWNLVTNAIKFSSSGGRIIVRLERIGDRVQIQVEDMGRGIEPEFLPHVFERFRQSQSSSTREYGGLGLGLAIVRHLTELHNGTVAVSSPGLGQGATFSVKLPLMNKPTIKQLDNTSTNESIELDRFSGIKILVVEDEVDSRDILTLVLEQEGATVTPVTSAKQALEIFEQSAFDLIISDIGMPEMDGYSLLSQIRQLPQGKNIPAIALTAYAGDIDRQHSLNVGFQEHICKPIDIPKLIATIVQLIQLG
ncbi:MAG TPA: PAS domain-containing protein [Coleofasciculaceae cyanobacterium]|jgi:PAS domain S-box-containing protein